MPSTGTACIKNIAVNSYQRIPSMNHTLKYGSGSLHLEIPDTCDVSVFTPQQVEPLDNPLAVFMNALDAAEGCPALEKMPTPESAAIAVPDETRPFPIKLLLPPLLERIFTSYPSLPHHMVRIVVGGGFMSRPTRPSWRAFFLKTFAAARW